MSEKSSVLTLRVDDETRRWVEHIARFTDLTMSSFLDRLVRQEVCRIRCCDRGPNSCDHVWCDICGGWSKDSGSMHNETTEAYFSCYHFQGFSRCLDTDIPPDKLQRNGYVDPFQVKTFRQFVGETR